jgi:hypothetical protein
MAHDVFISYSQRDKPTADAACVALEATGLCCWIAPRDVPPGMSWPTAIVGAIGQSRVMVLVFSSHAIASEEVQREVVNAFQDRVVVVPLRIEDVQPSGDMAYYMRTTHWLDAMTPPIEAHLQCLCATVKALVPSQKNDETLPRQELSPPKLDSESTRSFFESRSRAVIGAIILCLVIAVALACRSFLTKLAPVIESQQTKVAAREETAVGGPSKPNVSNLNATDVLGSKSSNTTGTARIEATPPTARLSVSKTTPSPQSPTIRKPDQRDEELKIQIRTEGNRVEYVEDEVMRYRVQANQACFLTLLSIDPSGDVTLLVPNAWHAELRLEKGKEVTIPTADMRFELYVRPPHGHTLIRAIATKKPLPIKGVDETSLKSEKLVFLANIKGVGVREKQKLDYGSEFAPRTLDMACGTRGWAAAELTLQTKPN